MCTKEGPWLNIEEQFDELLALITPRRADFQQLAPHCKFAIKCAVIIYVQHNALITPRRADFQQLAPHCKFAIKCAVIIYVQHNEASPLCS